MTAARRRIAALASLAVVALPALACAHARSLSHSRWTLGDDTAAVELRLPRNDLAAAAVAPGGAGLLPYATERLRMRRGGDFCAADAGRVLDGTEGWVVLAWTVRCPAGGDRAIESRLLAEAFPQHLHFARIAEPGGPGREQVLQARDGFVTVGTAAAPPEDAATTFARFVGLGVEHIATGWDHLAFVLALILLAASFGEVVALATGFTVAHSVTLALAVTGIVRPDQHGVEAVIGFSIALVAAENVWLVDGRPAVVPRLATGGLAALALAAALGLGRVDAGVLAGLALFSWCHFALLARVPRPARLRVVVAFAFGLVHGLGFAGILNELALPPGRLVVALGGFNVGVELGQLVVIALAWPLVRVAVRAGRERLLVEVGSSALCALGVFWLVVRTFGR